jgi:ubiquinone/menaquinone biosynthesis C-methylase UbiE
MNPAESHLDRVRERFTDSAKTFSAFALARRGEEATRFIERVTAELADASKLVAVDVACGPGTFTLPLAKHVGKVFGVDLTPAMLDHARAAAGRERVPNLEFKLGDAYSLPFEDGEAGIVFCGYSIHHMADPKRAIVEMARILAPGGRLGVADLIVVEGADPAANNAIERARDPSHATKQTRAQLRALIENAGVRLIGEEVHKRRYDFDEWMQSAGCQPGDPRYAETRRLMENSIPGDVAGLSPSISSSGKLEFLETILLILGEKP